jgi:ABC-type glycerol-3-phosphate transport system permease component
MIEKKISVPALMPISFDVQNYQSRIPIQNVIEAGIVMVPAIPVIVLLLAQKYFMQGLVITGAEK